MAWGLLSTGFIRKTLDEITTSLGDRLKAAFGFTVKTSAQSKFGQILGIVSAEVDDLWQVLEETNAAADPSTAVGQALDALCEITGTVRKTATYSLGTLYLTGDNGTLISFPKIAQNGLGDLGVSTTANATLATATAWAASTSYALGAVVRSSSNIYYCVDAGVSGSVALASESLIDTIVDGSAGWRYVGDGDAYATAPAQANLIGLIPIDAFEIRAIGNPVSGWRGVANVADFATGHGIESDEDLRLRRVLELHGIGRATVPALYSALSALPLVTGVHIFENQTASTDPDGVPPHSIECLVSGSQPAVDVAQAIFDTKAAGIGTHGSVSTVVNDDHGGTVTIKHNVPTLVPVYCEAVLSVDLSKWPGATGPTIAEDAILSFGDTLGVGYDVRPGAIVGALFDALRASGLLDCVVKVSTATITGGTPVAPVAISVRQVGDLDAARTTVVVVAVTP